MPTVAKCSRAKRRKQEEIDHPVFVRTEFGVGHIDLQNPLLGIFYGLFEGDFPVALVLLFEFFHGRKSLLRAVSAVSR